jgi:hypothetical protein
MVNFMADAYLLKKTQGYVYVHVDFEWRSPYDSINRNDDNLTNADIKSHALQGLISVSVPRPDADEPIYGTFRQDIEDYSKNDSDYQSDIATFVGAASTDIKVNNIAAYLYDTTLMYATTLDFLMKNNQNISATNIVDRLKSTSYKGITGTINLDENGDRIPTYYVDNWKNGQLEHLIEFNPLTDSIIDTSQAKFLFPGGATSTPQEAPKSGIRGE